MNKLRKRHIMTYLIIAAFVLPLMGLVEAVRNKRLERRRGLNWNS